MFLDSYTMKFNEVKLHFVSPGTKSYHKQLGKINTKIQKYGMWTQICVLCSYFSKIFVISYNDWIKIWRISLYFTPVFHASLKWYSGTSNTWNLVSQLSVHYKSCHNMLNMYLSQIICLNKQHVSSNVHVVNFVSCRIKWSQSPTVNTFSPHLTFSNSNLFQSNTGPAVSSMCKKGSSDHVNNMTERVSAWHMLKSVTLSFTEMKAQGLHRFTYTQNKKLSFSAVHHSYHPQTYLGFKELCI